LPGSTRQSIVSKETFRMDAPVKPAHDAQIAFQNPCATRRSRPEENEPHDRQHKACGDRADGQQREDRRPRLCATRFGWRFHNPAMTFNVFNLCHCVLIRLNARTSPRKSLNRKRPMADVVPVSFRTRTPHRSGGCAVLEYLSSTVLEHAGTLLRQRYAVKDYFPKKLTPCFAVTR
jgi:hypothetical protein